MNHAIKWLDGHQFNVDGPGGTYIVANTESAAVTVVPLPGPVCVGIAGRSSVGGLAAVRRRVAEGPRQ